MGVFHAIHRIVISSLGVAGVLREVFAGFSEKIVFGGYNSVKQALDVLASGHHVNYICWLHYNDSGHADKGVCEMTATYFHS